jgi:hypothetical protein
MNQISIEQALFGQAFQYAPAGAEATSTLEPLGRSAGFHEEWTQHAEELIHGFGDRPAGVKCPLAVFAQPFAGDQVAVVQVADQADNMLAFHFLVLPRTDYETFLGDPFHLAQKLPAEWPRRGVLPTHSWPSEPLPPRTVEQVCQVLARLKAGALSEDFEPPPQEEKAAEPTVDNAEPATIAPSCPPAQAKEIERTAENSESPALLGGTQVLVDGGRVFFKRPAPDLNLIHGLWTLLPNSTRRHLWPASFAFSNHLQFDAVVLPRPDSVELEGYTSEEQAIHYPEGHYELSLQIAAETRDQHQLDRLMNRRSVVETWRLGLFLLTFMLILVIASSVIELLMPKGPPPLSPEHRRMRAAAAASMVGVGDPLTAIAVHEAARTVKIEEEKK